MCCSERVQRVLKILAKNAADKLKISLPETKQLLWGMNGMGIIECNMEVDYSLITQQGFNKISC